MMPFGSAVFTKLSVLLVSFFLNVSGSQDIDINPCFEVLVEFHKAIALTNYVLQQLDKSLVPVTQDYFSRTLTRIDERDNLSKEQLFNFMAVLMNSQQDTVTSILGEVQNGMFSQQYTEVAGEDNSFNQTITIEPDNEEFQESQDEKSSQTQPKISSEQPAVKSIFLEEIEKAIAINPDNGDYWAKKSLYLSNLKKHEESLESIEEAILIDRKNDKYWYLKSLVLFDLNKHEAALKCIERAISLNQENDKYWHIKSEIYRNLNKKEKALESIEKAISLSQGNDKYWECRCKVLRNLDRYEEALESIEKAISINHYDQDYHKTRNKIIKYLSGESTGLVGGILDALFG